MKRGQGILTVEGKEWFYSFGTRAIRLYSENTGKTKQDLINLIGSFDKTNVVVETEDMSDLLFAGLVAGARIRKGVNVSNPGFDQGDVDDLVDLLSIEQINAVLLDLMRSLLPPEGLEVFEKALEDTKKKLNEPKPKTKKAKKKDGSDSKE